MASFAVQLWRRVADVRVLGSVGGRGGGYHRSRACVFSLAPPRTGREAITMIHRCIAEAPSPRQELGGRDDGNEEANPSAVPGGVVQHEWTLESRRTGVIAVKLGMTQLWNKEGEPMAVTVLRVG